MIFLPIFERELRGAARRRATYAMRVRIGAGALLALTFCYVLSLTSPGFHFGEVLFWGLGGLCMIYCVGAGRLMTADCLSWEKREGTFGLLFLTDLKGYDVVVGKMAASSLNGFYGMLTILPILAIPLLAGGLTQGEFWRMALVLVDTFLFSLSVGLCASAVSRDEQKAKGTNLALLLGLAGLPPIIGLVLQMTIPGFTAGQQLFYTCPVYAFFQCPDRDYRLLPNDFWWCLAVTFSLTILLVFFACRVAPRSWQDKPPAGRKRKAVSGRRRRWWRDGSAKWERAFRKRLLDRNAYLWLASRPPLRAAYVLVFLGLLTSFCAVNLPTAQSFVGEVMAGFLVLLNVTLKLWMTAESSRQLAHDKKSGAFELLLSTPLTVRELLRGEILALRRQFLLPVTLAATSETLLALFFPRVDTLQRYEFLAAIILFVADAVTLPWVGMMTALTTASYGKATVKTAWLVLVLPWAIWGGLALVQYSFGFLFVRHYWQPSASLLLGSWLAVGIIVDVVLVFRVRCQLSAHFRRLAFETPRRGRRFAWLRELRSGSPERKAVLQARLRRVALTVSGVAVIAAAAVLYDLYAVRAYLPPPVAVRINGKNGRPLESLNWRNGFLFHLPDGSLWRWGTDNSIGPPKRLESAANWTQTSSGDTLLALQSNGTLWNWTDETNSPRQIGAETNWAEVRAGYGVYVARKKDGTLWAWGRNARAKLGTGPPSTPSDGGAPVRVGEYHDWKAIARAQPIIALRTNGTMWIWGEVNWLTNITWYTTNFISPVRLCQESNWVGFYGRGGDYALNQAGETWKVSTLRALPDPKARIAIVARMLSSNANSAAFGPMYTTNWNFGQYQVHTNGTLWVTPWPWPDWPPGSALGPPRRVGNRSDWVSVWCSGQTMTGLTADGTLWTWGLDPGQNSRWIQVFVERIALVKLILQNAFGNTGQPIYGTSFGEYPEQVEPRPLLRLVSTDSTEATGARR